VKWAATSYPCYRFVLAQWQDGAWRWQEVPSG